MPKLPENLVEALLIRLEEQETAPALRFLNSGDVDGPQTEWDFLTLHRRARRVAADLAARGLAQKPVLLIYPPGLDFVAAFIGCQYANAIAVPLYPPSPADLTASIARILTIASDSDTRTALTSSELRRMAMAMAPHLPLVRGFEWITPDEEQPDQEVSWEAPRIASDSVAFLQYTSGSSGEPKGVVVRHDNLWFNLRAMGRVYPTHPMVSWLPAYHDMGLIGAILGTMALGGSLTLLPPHEFLRRPARWMRAVSHFRAGRTVGPNFGYMLAASKSRRSADLEGLDLSCLRHAIVGAEPISPRMIRAFTRTFAPYGLDPRALTPAYGLAEATLLVSTGFEPRIPVVRSFDASALTRGEVRSAAGGERELVGCGVTIPGQRIIIVDPQHLRPVAESCVGEILITGPSVAREYWRREDSRREVFQCEVTGERDTFLRTGDLGFLRDGELFVTGRLKDLIIIRGKNHAACDIEATLERDLASQLRPGRVVAASIETPGGEALLVLAEVLADTPASSHAALMTDIAGAVAEHHGVSVHTVALFDKGALPRTSSGKLRRSVARDAFVKGSLAVRALWSCGEAGEPTNDASLYRDFAEIRDRLDQRSTAYRFDVERDIPWADLDRPGVYIPRSVLLGLGIDVGGLASHPEAFEVFQWAAALSICRTFELLEWGLVQFCRREQRTLGATRSIENLCVEEEKHIRAFRRYAAHLEARRPELVGPFEAACRESFSFLRGLFEPERSRHFHLQIWLDTLLFEPYTLYLSHALSTAKEVIQPVWLRLHELHAREEGHHVVTVGQYAGTINLDSTEREYVTQRFLGQLRRGFLHIFGIMAPERLVHERWPGLLLRTHGPNELPSSFLHLLRTEKHFGPLRRVFPSLVEAAEQDTGGKLPDIVFVLSSERSGSTLLRIMLSGHPELFSPPELNLLTFTTLAERARRLPESQQDGLVQAWMQLHEESRGEALERLARATAESRSTLTVYEDMLRELDGTILVDKSPLYSRDLAALQRAESHFRGRARYVFLTRHPYAVVDSYARIGLQRLVSDELPAGRDPHELGEMGWTLSNRTILAFLAGIDPARCCRVRFEDLVSDPRAEMTRLLSFLGVPWNDAVLDPYRHGRMVAATGPDALVGDPNFASRSRIESDLGEAWKTTRLPSRLGDAARRVAAELDYPLAWDSDAKEEAPAHGARSQRDQVEVRATIVRILAQAARLPEGELRDDTKIVSLGFSSLDLIRLTGVIERAIGRPLPAMILYDHPTLAELVAHLAGHATSAAPVQRAPASFGAVVDLRAEVHLDDDLRVTDGAARPPQGAALLTGVTGFLGAYLLQSLLVDTNDVVHCLVRAEKRDAAFARIRENMARYGLWDEKYGPRIVPESGDLALPRLGLPARRFDELAERISAIHHNGALLRFDQPYEALRAANVDGTRNIIRLALQGPVKPLHYVSSMAVFDAYGHRGTTVDETTALEDWEGIRLGYAQSKWVAERLVGLAAERGVPVTIYRPAGIAGHSESGSWNTGDLVCRILKGCIMMGAVPRLSFDMDMAPVDYVSRAIVRLSRQPGAAGAIYHLNHPRPISWSRLVAWMRFRGYSLEEVPYTHWLAKLKVDVRSEGHPLAPLWPFLSLRLPPDGLTLFEAREHRPAVACAATVSVLSGLGLRCPPIGHELLSTWFDFMTRDGFLPGG